jgi:hypothetical protein
MAKKSIAETVTSRGRCLCEMDMLRHRCPLAVRSLRCRAVSRLVLALPLAMLSSTVGCGNTNAHCFAEWSTRRCCWLCTSTSPRSSKRGFASSNDRQCSLIERNSDAIQDPSLLCESDAVGATLSGSCALIMRRPVIRRLVAMHREEIDHVQKEPFIGTNR